MKNSRLLIGIKNMLRRLFVSTTARQFVKFALTGVLNTLVHLSVYYALLYFGTHYLIANGLGFCCGVACSYLVNSRFVFNDRSGDGLRKVSKFFMACAFTALLCSVVMFAAVEHFHVSRTLAPLLGIAVSTPTNFLLSRFWVFTGTSTNTSR